MTTDTQYDDDSERTSYRDKLREKLLNDENFLVEKRTDGWHYIWDVRDPKRGRGPFASKAKALDYAVDMLEWDEWENDLRDELLNWKFFSVEKRTTGWFHLWDETSLYPTAKILECGPFASKDKAIDHAVNMVIIDNRPYWAY